MSRSEKWVIYKIRHRMTSSSPVVTRYQFTDGEVGGGTSAREAKLGSKPAKIRRCINRREGWLLG
jgi:hypothetical protein